MTEDAMAERVRSYSDVFAMGHKALSELFDGEVIVEEKIDGSQFSFCKTNGQVLVRSKGKQMVVDAPEKMFAEGVAAVLAVADKLPEGLTFRGEYLKSPKHNTLCYSRIPAGHVIIFDVDKGYQDYMGHAEKAEIAASLGFEVVPLLFHGRIETLEQLKALLPKESILGGAQPEGIVVKNYARFAADKKVLMGKYVCEEFLEVHAKEWKKANPSGTDIIGQLIDEYRTTARFEKAIQHLREDGKLEGTPRDIGALLAEVEADIEKECKEEIKGKLWEWAWHRVARGAKAGLPEFYKNKLLESALPAGKP